MQKTISLPDDEWVGYITKMWALGNQISEDLTKQQMDGSMNDLDRLQAIIDSGKITADLTLDLQTLGIIFGRVFVNEMPDFDWWIVEDEHGKGACLRYKETNLLVYPQTILSKRIEEGENMNVKEFYFDLKQNLEKVIQENFTE